MYYGRVTSWAWSSALIVNLLINIIENKIKISIWVANGSKMILDRVLELFIYFLIMGSDDQALSSTKPNRQHQLKKSLFSLALCINLITYWNRILGIITQCTTPGWDGNLIKTPPRRETQVVGDLIEFIWVF